MKGASDERALEQTRMVAEALRKEVTRAKEAVLEDLQVRVGGVIVREGGRLDVRKGRNSGVGGGGVGVGGGGGGDGGGGGADAGAGEVVVVQE